MNSFFYSQEMPFFAALSALLTRFFDCFCRNKKATPLIESLPVCQYDTFSI